MIPVELCCVRLSNMTFLNVLDTTRPIRDAGNVFLFVVGIIFLGEVIAWLICSALLYFAAKEAKEITPKKALCIGALSTVAAFLFGVLFWEFWGLWQ